MYDNSTLEVYNTSSSQIDLYNNKTAHIESTTVAGYIRHDIEISQGANVIAYNSTIIGADIWAGPKVTLGPGNSIGTYYYQYTTRNAVNLALFNTTLYYLSPNDNSNITAHFCSAQWSNTYLNGNLTLYNSTMFNINTAWRSNITLFNSTVNAITLNQLSYAWIADYSTVVSTLTLNQNTGYYLAADSTIGTVVDNR